LRSRCGFGTKRANCSTCHAYRAREKQVNFRRSAPLPWYKELGMREVKKAGFALCIGMAIFILAGFGPRRSTTVPGGGETEAFAQHVAALRSGKPQQKAAAAYWLGQQHSAAASAVDSLLE